MLKDVNDIIEFAEWRYRNRWFNYDLTTDKWLYTFESGTAISKNQYREEYMKTTAELTELFLKEKDLLNKKS